MEAQDFLRGLLVSGMTQAAVAEQTGIPQPTLSRLARGVTTDLPSRRVRKLQALWELHAAQPPNRAQPEVHDESHH